MKHFACFCAAAAFALVGATAAVASDPDWDHGDHHGDHDGDHHDHDGDHHDHDGDHHDHDGDHGWHDGDHGDHHGSWSHDWDRNHGWGFRPHWWRGHSWHSGDRFHRYRGDNYLVINDWWFYGLDRPRHDAYWVRTWDGFVLISRRGFVIDFVER